MSIRTYISSKVYVRRFHKWKLIKKKLPEFKQDSATFFKNFNKFLKDRLIACKDCGRSSGSS